MTQAKHTQGPWTITSDSTQWHYIHAPNAGIVAEVGKRSNVSSEGIANARLIAAAPELLEACIAITESGITGPNMDLIRNAIAKARGQ